MIGSNSSANLVYSVLAVVGTYAITSIVMLNFPEVLHKKKKQYFHAAHISHRGGAGENIENTLTAYHHAIKSGTQMLELDVNISKDKQVVVCHDNDLSRVTDQRGNICDYNYQDLPPLKKDLSVTFYKSATFHHEGEPERMPTLEEVFKAFPTIPINLDVKVDDEELMNKCAELIKKYDREKLMVWGSQKHSAHVKLQKLNPEIPSFLSARRVLLLYAWFYTGLLPFIPLKETHFEILLPDISKYSDFTTGRKFWLFVLGWLMKSKFLIAHLKKRGIPTYFWVLNVEKDYETAFKLGATGVMTDYPTKLRNWLDAHPQYWNQK